MDISPQLEKELHSAILSAYPTEASLEQLVRFSIQVDLEHVAKGKNHSEIVFNLLKWIRSQGSMEGFVAAAVEYNPGNSNLAVCAQKIRRHQKRRRARAFDSQDKSSQISSHKQKISESKIDGMIDILRNDALIPMKSSYYIGLSFSVFCLFVAALPIVFSSFTEIWQIAITIISIVFAFSTVGIAGNELDEQLITAKFYTTLTKTDERREVILALKKQDWGGPLINWYMRRLIDKCIIPDLRNRRKR